MTYLYIIAVAIALAALWSIAGSLTKIVNGIAILSTAQLVWLGYSNDPESLKAAHDQLAAALGVEDGNYFGDPQ